MVRAVKLAGRFVLDIGVAFQLVMGARMLRSSA